MEVRNQEQQIRDKETVKGKVKGMNKVTKYFAVLAVALLVTASVKANGPITVNWSAQIDTGVALADGTTLVPGGSSMSIGTFTVAPTLGSSSLANYVVFDTNTMGVGFGGIDGFFSAGSLLNETNGANFGFTHMQIYLVIDAGSQRGIFTSTSWAFPGSGDNPASTTIDVTQVVPGGVIFGAAKHAGGPAGNLIDLAIIPEPSTIVLVGFGLLGAVGVARRRRS